MVGSPRKRAEAATELMNRELSGQSVAMTTSVGLGRPRVEVPAEFKEAYNSNPPSSRIAIVAGGYVFTGGRLDEFNIDSNRRQITATVKNGWGETVHHTWTLIDKSEHLYQVLVELEKIIHGYSEAD
jgi:hypothetical protein